LHIKANSIFLHNICLVIGANMIIVSIHT